MSLQYRKREGDRRWTTTDRDLVYALPRMLRRALETFDDFQGADGVTREQLLDAASRLGVLATKVLQAKISKEDLLKELKTFPKEEFDMISRALAFVLLGELRAWVGDAKPKASGDIELEDYDLDGLAEFFARGAR